MKIDMTEPGLYPWTIMDPGVIPSFVCCYVDSRHNTVLKCISLSMSWVDLRFFGGLDIILEPDQWHFSKPKSGAQATAVALHQRVAKDATPAGSAMLGLLCNNNHGNMVREGRDNKLGVTCSVQNGSDFMMGSLGQNYANYDLIKQQEHVGDTTRHGHNMSPRKRE